MSAGKKDALATPTDAAAARTRSWAARMSGRRWSNSEGRPKVLLRRGQVRSYALVDELTHVIQLERMLAAKPRD